MGRTSCSIWKSRLPSSSGAVEASRLCSRFCWLRSSVQYEDSSLVRRVTEEVAMARGEGAGMVVGIWGGLGLWYEVVVCMVRMALRVGVVWKRCVDR